MGFPVCQDFAGKVDDLKPCPESQRSLPIELDEETTNLEGI